MFSVDKKYQLQSSEADCFHPNAGIRLESSVYSTGSQRCMVVDTYRGPLGPLVGALLFVSPSLYMSPALYVFMSCLYMSSSLYVPVSTYPRLYVSSLNLNLTLALSLTSPNPLILIRPDICPSG